MADIASLSDPRQHCDLVAKARDEPGNQRQHGKKDGRDDALGNYRSAQDSGEGRSHHWSGGWNITAYIHALVEGRDWQVEGSLGRISGKVRGVDHVEGDSRSNVGEHPFPNLFGHNIMGSVKKGPGAQGEVRLASLGQIFLGRKLLREMGHSGCFIAFKNRDQDYSRHARIFRRVCKIPISLDVRPGVVSLRACRVGAEARGAGNHSFGQRFCRECPL
jgi:hypothetical protein